MYLGPTREPTKEEIEAIAKAFENAAKPGSIRPIMPCPAIDQAKYKRKEAIEQAMYMGGCQIHFDQHMKGLYRLVAYRAEVAKQLNKGCCEVEMTALEELFDYCNNQIKEYLAIL